MAKQQPFITLESGIMDYIDEAELSLNKYSKCFNIAYRALDELGMDFFYKVQSVKLPILPNLTVKLPANYIQYSKIGVLNDRGEVIPLFQNDNLTTYADLWPNRIQVTQDDTLFDPTYYDYPIFYNYWNGNAVTNVYGIPSGDPFIGSYKIDVNNGVILLSENFIYQYIILEYVASPDESQPYMIPRQFREAVIAYLRWKYIVSIPAKTHVYNANIGMRRHDFFNERRIALARWKPWDLNDAYERNLRDQRMTTKA